MICSSNVTQPSMQCNKMQCNNKQCNAMQPCADLTASSPCSTMSAWDSYSHGTCKPHTPGRKHSQPPWRPSSISQSPRQRSQVLHICITLLLASDTHSAELDGLNSLNWQRRAAAGCRIQVYTRKTPGLTTTVSCKDKMNSLRIMPSTTRGRSIDIHSSECRRMNPNIYREGHDTTRQRNP